tara:strand:+ start:2991 stop:3272 length:282 start_codon:yes stop_codon:yes gene_type:complete
MKIHLYKNTPFGIERVNDSPLTIEEARAVLKGNPSLTARDAESAAYEVLHMPIDWQDEEPTCQELAIASNLSVGLKIAACVSVALFIAEKLLP